MGSLINGNKLNIAVFKLRRDGEFAAVPLRYNPKAFDTGYAGTVNFLTATPDGRFLIAECQNTNDGNYQPYFLQYRVQTDGQLKPYARFSLITGGRNLVFHPSGRFAYLSCPNQSSSQSSPGTIAEFHVTPQGDILYPPFAFVPCSAKPSALALDSRGRTGAVVDADTGFLWQYTLTPQGALLPVNPPSVPVARSFVPLMAGDGRSLYVLSQQSRERYRIYQLRRSGGGFSLLMPWAVRLPGVIWGAVISNKYRILYVSTANLLLTFYVGPQGALQPGRFRMSTTVGVKIAIDEQNDCLYVLGLRNSLRAYRIHEGGRLTALGPAAVGAGMALTVVHR